jgi:hypothetical protein
MRVLILLLATTLSVPALAEIYHYVDERGRKVFVNSLSKVPHQYRDQLQTRDEPGSLNGLARGAQTRAAGLDDVRRQISRSLSELDAAIAELETPVEVGHNRVILPVRAVYGNRRADTRMLLDTGASGTVFHREALAPLRGATYRAGTARVASGEMIDVQAINLDRIEIGPFRIPATRAMVIDPVGRSVHDGLLGMDFLRQVEYRIDYERARIIWEPERYEQLLERREQLRAQQQLDADQLLEALTGAADNAP